MCVGSFKANEFKFLKIFPSKFIIIRFSKWISTNLFWAGTTNLEHKLLLQTPSLSPGSFKANKIKLLQNILYFFFFSQNTYRDLIIIGFSKWISSNLFWLPLSKLKLFLYTWSKVFPFSNRFCPPPKQKKKRKRKKVYL